MLQYIIGGSNSFDIIETAKTALFNGCQWIRLDISKLTADDCDKIIKKLQQSCKNFEAILTVENDVDAVKRWKVDGVHLDFANKASAIQVRKTLGEEPIIGITIKDSSEVPFIPRTAADYVEIDVNVDDLAIHAAIVNQMKQTGMEEPVVAHFASIPSLSSLIQSGVNGIALNSATVNPVELKDLIRKLDMLNEDRLNAL